MSSQLPCSTRRLLFSPWGCSIEPTRLFGTSARKKSTCREQNVTRVRFPRCRPCSPRCPTADFFHPTQPANSQRLQPSLSACVMVADLLWLYGLAAVEEQHAQENDHESVFVVSLVPGVGVVGRLAGRAGGRSGARLENLVAGHGLCRAQGNRDRGGGLFLDHRGPQSAVVCRDSRQWRQLLAGRVRSRKRK